MDEAKVSTILTDDSKVGPSRNSAVAPHAYSEILRRLSAAENEHGVRILYACESGSRAWGFHSEDSDYDVRFIYVRPLDWYLTYDQAYDEKQLRDVIEHPIVDEIDCNGWDLRKAMYLYSRTNGALLEWLKSPIRYIERGPLAQGLRDLESKGANRVGLCYHYSHMARGNVNEYLGRDSVRLKKYLYILRPLLAIRYILATDSPPPIEFEKLVDAVAPDPVKPAIRDLVDKKRNQPELGYGDPIPEINEFITAELEEHGAHFRGQGRPDLENSQAVRASLSSLFRQAIRLDAPEPDIAPESYLPAPK